MDCANEDIAMEYDDACLVDTQGSCAGSPTSCCRGMTLSTSTGSMGCGCRWVSIPQAKQRLNHISHCIFNEVVQPYTEHNVPWMLTVGQQF